jgi:hypothetical protein
MTEEDDAMSIDLKNVQTKLQSLKVRAEKRKNSVGLRHAASSRQIEILNENHDDLENEQTFNILKKK